MASSWRARARVALDPFLIDVYEVTNAQFAAFLNTLKVTAKRDVRAGELRPDDVEGPAADRLWGGSSGNDRAFIEMDPPCRGRPLPTRPRSAGGRHARHRKLRPNQS